MILAPDRTIVHMDLDCFFVAVSRLMNPALNGKPVLIGGSSDRGVVAACSYEARKYGIHSAMPVKLAKRLCPEALIVHGDYDMYTRKSDEVTEIIRENVPLYEKSSIDEFYIDMTGMDRFFGCFKWAKELWQKVKKETTEKRQAEIINEEDIKAASSSDGVLNNNFLRDTGDQAT